MFSNSVGACQRLATSLAEEHMGGKRLLDFWSPRWPIDELGFLFLNAVFLSGQCSFRKVDRTK